MTALGFILVGLGILLIVSVLLNSWEPAWQLLSGGNGLSNTIGASSIGGNNANNASNNNGSLPKI